MKMSELCFRGWFWTFFDMFWTFFDILSWFSLSGLSNDWPVAGSNLAREPLEVESINDGDA